MPYVGNQTWSGTGIAVNDSSGFLYCQTFTTSLPINRLEALLRSASASTQATFRLVQGTSATGTALASGNVFMPQSSAFTGLSYVGLDIAQQPAGTYTLVITKPTTGSTNFFIAYSTANPYADGSYFQFRPPSTQLDNPTWDIAFRAQQVEPPPGPTVKRWNGTQWVNATVQRYNGSTWATATLTRY